MTKKLQHALWACIGLVYFSNLFVPILEIDAAQYAEMSREMLQQANWLHLFDIGTDYLDKPPFLFWVSALSMKLLGITSWAYKLPSILFAVWAIYALYRFAKIFYNHETSQTAAFIFAACQAMFLVTNDIKTDTILLSFVITAFWQLSAWLYEDKKLAWVWGAICIGGAMITKGPIGILIIGFGFLPQFIIKKQWINLLRWQYLPMLAIIALVLLPMSYGLYTQFDLQPEKLVNGKKGVSGLRFFYWTQSFGRITGESVWNNNAGFTFLYSNLLWGLFPFTLFFVMGTIKGFIKLAKRATQTEWISSAAVILGYISLGMSKFQLPHYIYVVLPFICLLVARYYISTKNFFGHKFRILRLVHNSLLYLVCLVLPVLVFLFFPTAGIFQKIILVIAFIAVCIIIYYSEKTQKLSLITSTILFVFVLNIILNFVFYPNLIPYQKEYVLAKEIKNLQLDKESIGSYNLNIGRSCDFLLQTDIDVVKDENIKRYEHLITGDKGLLKLDSLGTKHSIIFTADGYHVARLKIGFLIPATRNEYTNKYYITQLQ